jgi:RND family efflux transporter MFP subunit
MKRKKRLILIVLSATLVIGGVVLATGRLGQITAAPIKATVSRPSLAVRVTQPVQATWPLTLTAYGALAAWQEDTISAEMGGLSIVALHADIGSRVKRGQLLAELNSETLKSELQKAEAAVASARASLRQAQADVRRGHAVQESGALSGQQIEQYEITEQSAEANLASSEASLAAALIHLKQARIVAVNSGVISSRAATLGTVVNSGSELFRLVREERVEWRAEVDSNQLALLKKGQMATVTLPGGATVKGRVRQLSPTLDSKTRTAFAYIELPVQTRIRAGAYVTGRIDLGQQAALTIPNSAIVLRDGRSYVFEVDSVRNVVIQREVVTGRTRDDRIEIVTGLVPSTPIVPSGGAFLNDGDSVRIVSPKESA